MGKQREDRSFQIKFVQCFRAARRGLCSRLHRQADVPLAITRTFPPVDAHVEGQVDTSRLLAAVARVSYSYLTCIFCPRVRIYI